MDHSLMYIPIYTKKVDRFDLNLSNYIYTLQEKKRT